MAYHMKSSPINKGTAANPSPMKEPFSLTAALITAGIGAAVSGGTAAISGAQKKKAAKKAAKEQKSAEANAAVSSNMANADVGGGGSKIV